jgi:hypothetical protein
MNRENWVNRRKGIRSALPIGMKPSALFPCIPKRDMDIA